METNGTNQGTELATRELGSVTERHDFEKMY